jgi:hypothetical protein
MDIKGTSHIVILYIAYIMAATKIPFLKAERSAAMLDRPRAITGTLPLTLESK